MRIRALICSHARSPLWRSGNNGSAVGACGAEPPGLAQALPREGRGRDLRHHARPVSAAPGVACAGRVLAPVARVAPQALAPPRGRGAVLVCAADDTRALVQHRVAVSPRVADVAAACVPRAAGDARAELASEGGREGESASRVSVNPGLGAKVSEDTRGKPMRD